MSYAINERTSGQYVATLKDETGVVVAGSALTALTLSLTDVATGGVINSRTTQNVLNANNVTVSELGVVTWALQPADNTITTASRTIERHRAEFSATWAAGAKRCTWAVDIDVTNLGTIT